MFKILTIVISIVLICPIIYWAIRRSKIKTLYPLLPKQYNFSKRKVTFLRSMKLMEERKAKVLVETGVARNGLQNTKGDGASTIVFGLWSKANNASLYSVDINESAVNTAQNTIDDLALNENVKLSVSDSIKFLEDFNEQIDFLYLDSYDYNPKDPENQKASQEHHLNEIKAAESNLHKNSIILIDDCKLNGGGKGKLVVEYLKEKGWKVDKNMYQILMIRS
jgi:predicted O-methyltransferase YrrM